jgi:VWFA-related protein
MTQVIVLNRTNRALGLCSSLFLFCLLTVAALPLRAQTSATPAATTTPAPSEPTPQSATPALQTPAASQPPAASPQVTTPAAPQQPGTQPAASLVQQPPALQSDSQPAHNPDQPTETIKVQVNEVNLIFTVTDKKGKFITGLKRENFGLLDDGRPPLAVLRFTQQTNLPLRVGIMLDTSSSIRQRFQFEQDSAIEFFLQILHRDDRAFVEGFDIQTDLAQDFTNNVDLLNQGIRKLRPGGGTALFDALYKTCKDQMLTLQETGAVRRALILVSDGDDNYSRVQESDAIKMCQRADTIVYTISTNISPSKDKGDDVLRQISEATGGQPFYPTRLEDVAIGFRNIQEELRSQYHLVYRPANLKMDGAFRTIYLQATDPRYHVRAQKGYFAPRPLQ